MKKVFVVITIMLLFFIFLNYCGVFKDNTDPLKVTQYFFDYLRNREWFLTYQLYKYGYFDASFIYKVHENYEIALIKKIELKLLSTESNEAEVEAKIIYRNDSVVYGVLSFEKMDKIWLIKNIKFR